MRTPAEETPQAGPAGLVFFLIAITVFSDAAQYAWDRLIGKHKISARISDDKTWEGLAGGTLTSWIAFVLLAPWFSPIPFWPSVFVGGILPIWGAAGSLTMSAVKRDLGVSSSSLLLPGFGGALDRIASLTFTAPWFFHMHAIFALERF
jgi:phosphatidate cytidylyltransferase